MIIWNEMSDRARCGCASKILASRHKPMPTKRKSLRPVYL